MTWHEKSPAGSCITGYGPFTVKRARKKKNTQFPKYVCMYI